MKRNSIAGKVVYGIIAVALLVVILVGAILCYGVVVLSNRHYMEDSMDYASIVAHVIDGDSIPGYEKTGGKDGYYYDIKAFLDAFCDEVELSRIEVFIPDDDMIYLWDTGCEGKSHDLGESAEVIGNEKEFLDDVFSGRRERFCLKLNIPDEGWILCAYSPVFNSSGEIVAVVSITRPTLYIKTILSQFILAISLAIIVLSALIMLISYRLLEKNIIRPIGILTKSAETMVTNIERDEVVNIDIHTNDELETLAEAFTRMDIDLRDYIKELSAITSERERIRGELDVAARIQMGILPKKGLQYNEMSEFDLAASMMPAREVGGDFYDIFMADDRHLALVIGDVSDKGVPSALFMVATKILIKYSIKQNGISPAEAFRIVNERLTESNELEMFVTAWLMLIDLDTGECIEANAGHEHPAVRRQGDFELIRYKHSPALAAFDGITFSERSFRLEPGDTVFVYTDGVTEATDSDKRLFGEERLLLALNKDSKASPEELLGNVRETIDGFVGDAPQFDDITMLAFRYNGKQ